MDPRTRMLLLGLGGGVAAALAFPIVVPIVAEVARPVTKALLRGGLIGFDYVRTHAAKLTETFEDIVAEVSAEVKAELERRATAGAAAGLVVTALRDHGEAGSASAGASSVS